MMSNRDAGSLADRWCMIRTAGPRTLSLTRSLREAGFDAWAPTQIVQRRRPRSPKKLEIEAPILPTFVFVRADRLQDLRVLRASSFHRHPAFSVFQFAGDTPLLHESTLKPLRDEERRAAIATEARRRGEQVNANREARDELRQTVPVGSTVNVPHAAFVGITGVVAGGDRKNACVNVGAGWRLKIDTWLFAQDHIENAQA